MRIAYLIIAHKNLNQLATLINLLTLEAKNNFCFIYIDFANFEKSDVTSFRKAVGDRNCIFINKAFKVMWGGFSLVQVTLTLLYEALNFPGKYFDYISLMSGQDLPLKTNEFIHDYLLSNLGTEFIENFVIPDKSHWSGNGGLDRIDYHWYIDQIGFKASTRLVNIQKRKKAIRPRPKSLKIIYGGSQWWTITSGCAEFILSSLIDKAELYQYFRTTYIPDELIFHTLILNSSFGKQVCNNNLRFIDWTSGPTYPKILDIFDENRLRTTDKLFARKFDINLDSDIIGMIRKDLETGTSLGIKYKR